MTSGPITSWQIDEETMETVADFIFLGSKITADGDCSLGMKTDLFSPVATAEFSKCAGMLSAALSQHCLSGAF